MAKKDKWRKQMAATLGFDEAEDLEKSQDAEGEDPIEKARKTAPAIGVGDQDEDDEDEDAAPSQDDMDTSAAPGKPAAPSKVPPQGVDADGDGDEDDEADNSPDGPGPSAEQGTDDEDDDDDDDDDADAGNFKNKVIRRSQQDPDLLKSIVLENPDLLKSLFEGEGGQQVAEMLDASDVVAYIVDTFDRLHGAQLRNERVITKSLELRIAGLEETLDLLGAGLAEMLPVIKSFVAPDLQKSQRPTPRVGSGLGGLMPPRRVDPAASEPDAQPKKAGKAKRAALTEEAQNTLLKSRLPVRKALMQAVDEGVISSNRAADFIGKLGSAEGIRDTLAFMQGADETFFKSQPGVDTLLTREDILIKAS